MITDVLIVLDAVAQVLAHVTSTPLFAYERALVSGAEAAMDPQVASGSYSLEDIVTHSFRRFLTVDGTNPHAPAVAGHAFAEAPTLPPGHSTWVRPLSSALARGRRSLMAWSPS